MGNALADLSAEIVGSGEVPDRGGEFAGWLRLDFRVLVAVGDFFCEGGDEDSDRTLGGVLFTAMSRSVGFHLNARDFFLPHDFKE